MGTHPRYAARGVVNIELLVLKRVECVPKKMAGAKKLLRLSPPHTHKPPEVPFLSNRETRQQKATSMRGSCVTSGDYVLNDTQFCAPCPQLICSRTNFIQLVIPLRHACKE
jgi:hypothetical protein